MISSLSSTSISFLSSSFSSSRLGMTDSTLTAIGATGSTTTTGGSTTTTFSGRLGLSAVPRNWIRLESMIGRTCNVTCGACESMITRSPRWSCYSKDCVSKIVQGYKPASYVLSWHRRAMINHTSDLKGHLLSHPKLIFWKGFVKNMKWLQKKNCHVYKISHQSLFHCLLVEFSTPSCSEPANIGCPKVWWGIAFI